MARKHKHEEHTNHEAWAIPYGDLVTLLLALFVVMYAVSSVNEGKYRVLADAMSEAFGGPPRSMKPIQIGSKERSHQPSQRPEPIQQKRPNKSLSGFEKGFMDPPGPPRGTTPVQEQKAMHNLQRMADAVEQAMGELISRDLVVVKRTEFWLEIEIRTDILFSSGSAQVAPTALPVLSRMAEILKPFPNLLRIEGHTDNVPISTAAFPSNWELSAARAASVVHLFMRQGVDPQRMTVNGLGEYRPVAANTSVENRNRNRRVVIVVLADSTTPPPDLHAQQAEPVVVPEGTLKTLHPEGA
jgi:chemotaxis protein MotB